METAAGALEGGASADPARSRRVESGDALDSEAFAMAQALIGSRQNVSPKRLVAHAPSPTELDALLSLAAAAPDHGQLNPRRFIVVPEAQRRRRTEVLALSLIDRDPGATLEQIESAREKGVPRPAAGGGGGLSRAA